MVKLELFRSRAFSGANVFTLILFFAFNAVLFFLPMTLVSAWSRPEWQASLVMVPLSLAIAVFSGRAGRLADRIGPRLLLTAGAASMALSYAGLALTMPLMLLWQVTLPILLSTRRAWRCWCRHCPRRSCWPRPTATPDLPPASTMPSPAPPG